MNRSGDMVHEQNLKTESEPKEQMRRLLRWLYKPYVWFIFIPYLAVTTLLFGIIAVFISLLSARLAFHVGTLWSWLLCRMNFSWVSIKGREHALAGQSYVLMSNHQSHFDVLAFYGHWGKQFRWVMKEELRKVPGLGWYCAAGGHIFIDRSDRKRAIESLQNARPLLKGGVSVMFFPEGSRSKDGRMKSFKKGGFIMARDLNLPILPISISGSRHLLPVKTLDLLPGHIRITIHEAIDVNQVAPEQLDELIQETRRRIASGLTEFEQPLE